MIAEMADRVAIMYAGKIVEQTDVTTIFNNPLHPYTVGLLSSVPVVGEIKETLDAIPGQCAQSDRSSCGMQILHPLPRS